VDFDVIVIGGGPIGCVVARDIAAAGCRVLVVEEHPRIGDPLRCSGLISSRTLQLSTTSIVFWAACAAFMAITVLSIGSAKSSLSAVGIFVAGAPVPLLLSLLEVMTTRTPAVVELEKACKYNANQLYVVKIMIGTVLNVALLALVTTFTSQNLITPLRMFLTGSTMMFFIGFLALLVATKFGQSLPVMGILAGWIIASAMLFENRHELAMMLLNIRLFPLLIILGVSTMLFIFSLHAFSHQLTTLDLGGTC